MLAAVLSALMPLVVLAGQAPAPALEAETTPDGIVPQIVDGRRIYLPAQFARFAPLTAADLLGLIPGFSVSNVSNDRGLGEASQNVLINGQRITGKGNDAVTVLRRTSFRSVVRLELVDGATLDITGLSGHVLNVITEQDGLKGNFVWRPQIRERIPDHLPAGEVNISGKSGIGNFTLGFRWEGFRGGGWGTETEYRPATNTTILREKHPRFGNDIPKLSGSLNRRFDSGSIWNFNASVDRQHFRRNIVTGYQLSGGSPITETSLGDNRRWRTEIGSDFEFGLGPGRLKLVGFYSQRTGPSVDEFTTLPEGATVPTGARFSRDATEGERVGRAEYRWKGGEADWTWSAEVAHNFIDATGTLDVLDSNGDYQPVPLPGSSSRVEELRGESLVSFNQNIGSGWSIQVGGGAEYSRMKQDGDNGQARSFWRPKLSVAMAYNPDSPWEFNLRLQRKAGQLNFFDFLASVDVSNNNTNGSNPDLQPPESWLLQLETVRNLGSSGKITLTLEGEDITNLVTQIPISPTLEAPGNLRNAQRLQATLNMGLLLDGIGIPGGRLDSIVTVRDTKMRDPLTGENRQFNGNRYYWNLEFRHDVPGTAWTWGALTEYQSTSYSYRLDSMEIQKGATPFVGAFLEHKDVLGLKVRLFVANVLRKPERTRQVAYVDRRDGPIDYTRDFPLYFGSFYRLQVSGTF